jgi:CheY-like chemotaxis protein
LAAALGIVRGHKGALKVVSEPGIGSTFEILFPVCSQALRKPQASPEEITRRPVPKPGHILVVDDEDLVRRTAKYALERHGFTVLLSENGQRAVDIFSGLSDQIALVLLDLTMPVMGGEEALGKLRAIRPDVDIILMSGYDEGQAMLGFDEAEVSGFLKKPYTGESLANAVRGILGRRSAAGV